MSSTNGWSEYQKLVLSEIKRLSGETKDLHGLVEEQGKSHAKILGHMEAQDAKIKVWSSLIALVVAGLVTMGFKFLG